jgi:hypothetical protein
MILQQLCASVHDASAAFADDPFCVFLKSSSFFTNCSVEDRLYMGRDALPSWLCSILEAHQHQLVFCDSQSTITLFFLALAPLEKKEYYSAGVSANEIDPGWILLISWVNHDLP